MGDADELWSGGPYAEPARKLVRTHRVDLTEQLHRYDELASSIEASREPWVLTHGEPHGGNTLRCRDGSTLLIDWDTLAIAPRERDLWRLIREPTGSVWDAYRAASGHSATPAPERMELFPLWVRLAEFGSYISRFRNQHVGDEDDTAVWSYLESHLG